MDKFKTLEDYQNSLKEFNERTRKLYEDFIQEYGDESQKLQLRCTPYTEKKGRYGVASLDFGFQIWQSRQAEIDEKDKRIESQSNCIENLVIQKSDYLDKVTKAIAHLDSFDHLGASINKLQRSIECALQALRGERE